MKTQGYRIWLAPLAAICVVLLSAAGCTRTTREPIVQVEAHKSAAQQLVLRNSGGDPVSLVAPDGNAEPLVVAPNGSVTIEFIVRTTFELGAAQDFPWMVMIPGTQISFVTDQVPPNYLKQDGQDVLIRILRDAAGPPEPFNPTVTGCSNGKWADGPAAPADHRFDLAALPAFGTPARLCPSGRP